jgi:putative ATPase
MEEAMPLAERMRPKTLDELVGQDDLVGPNGVLRELILTDRVPSMILWAGPGVVHPFAHRLTLGGQNDAS